MLRAAPARRSAEFAALAAILGLAATLRFAQLSQRGLIYWDEAKFALEGIRLEAGLRLLTGAPADLLAGKAVGTAKPMHAFLIALAYAVFGIHDYAALYLDALCGVLTVALTYVIGRRLFGGVAGLLSAAILAVSEYEAIYARSALSESDATVFFLAGVAIWLYCSPGVTASRSQVNRLAPLLAGLAFGFAFTTNYRLIVYVAVVVAIDLWRHVHASGIREPATRAALWAGGFLTAPILWQLGGTLAAAQGLVLFRGEVVRTPLPYWREVVYQLHEGKQSVLHFNPGVYLQWWFVRQGWLSSILLLAALVRAVWARRPRWLLPALLVVVPYTIYAFAPFVVPRNLVPALPFTAILVGALLGEVGGRAPWWNRAAAAALALLLLAAGAAGTWRLTSVRSGFAAAVHYVETHGNGRAVTSSEVPVFYLRGSGPTCDAPALPYWSGDLRAFIREGYALAILDRHNNSNLTRTVRRVEPMVARFPTLGRVQLGESLISSENSNPPSGDARTEYVNVFYLVPSRLPPASLGHPAPCRRDRVT